MKRVLFLLVTVMGLGSAMGTRIDSFHLSDQHQKSRQYLFPKNKLTLMAVADYKGSADLRAWITYVHRRFGNAIDIDGIADVSTVPLPLAGAIRMAFRQQLDYSVLLDWTGSVVRQFEYEKRQANLYLLDFDGTVITHVCGPPKPDGLTALSRAIFANLDRTRPDPERDP